MIIVFSYFLIQIFHNNYDERFHLCCQRKLSQQSSLKFSLMFQHKSFTTIMMMILSYVSRENHDNNHDYCSHLSFFLGLFLSICILRTNYNHEFYKIFMKICPECQCNKFYEDYQRGETTCRHCGLVLVGPVEYGVVHQGFKFVSHRKRAWRVSVSYGSCMKQFVLKLRL